MNTLKKSRKTQTVKRNKKNHSGPEVEMISINKTQTDGILKLTKLRNSNRTYRGNFTNRIQEMEERISGIEDMIEEMDISIKENVKPEKVMVQNI